MALFGKKKDENKPEEKNAPNSINSKEMDIILQARQEEEEERKARIAEREAEQEEYRNAIAEDMTRAAEAAADVISMFPATDGNERFFMLVDANVYTDPVNEGDEIVTGYLRGKIRKGQEIRVFSGLDDLNRVTVNAIRNDDRELIDEACNEKVELELSKGDFKDPESPDEEKESRVRNFSILTNLPAKEGMNDGIRLPAMLCEFSRYQGDQEFFGQLMNAAMKTEFIVPAKVTGVSGNQKRVAFAGLQSKDKGGKLMLPAFSSMKAFEKQKAMLTKTGGFNDGINMDFAQLCGIARDENHGGCVVDPLGPVIFSLPKPVLDTAVNTIQFHYLFGENKTAEILKPAPQEAEKPSPKLKEFNVLNLVPGGESNYIQDAVKKYGGSHADISKIYVVMIVAVEDPQDKAYVCIVDCPKEKFDMNCKGLERVIRPYMRTIRNIQFRPYDKEQFGGEFTERYPWTYNKLSF